MSRAQLRSTNILRTARLAKSYADRTAVAEVTLELRRGETIALLGPNGAGKTTLLSMIIGTVKPDFGCIEMDGRDITALPIYARAQLGLSYLPQESSVFRGLSVEDNIMLYLETLEPDRQRRHQRLETLLADFDLVPHRRQTAGRLSGGQKRRCEIARALATNPSYVLLDEPFAGVDPLAISDIQNTINGLRSRGIGVLISDHNVRETLTVADRGYVMVAGRIIAHGNANAIVNDDAVKRFYLGNSLA